MSDKASATQKGGTGLMTAGIVIAVLIAAGTFLVIQDRAQPSEEELSALVPGTGTEAGDTDTSSDQADGAAQEVLSEDAGSAEEDNSQSGTDLAAKDQLTAPTIDEVRVDAGGVAVIAGRATPGSVVQVLLDGEVVAETQADGSGSFAALGSVSAADAARVLSLRASQNGAEIASEEEVIIAPVASLPVPETDETDTDVLALADVVEQDAEQKHVASQVGTDAGTSDHVPPASSSEDEGQTVAQSEAPQETPATEGGELEAQADGLNRSVDLALLDDGSVDEQSDNGRTQSVKEDEPTGSSVANEDVADSAETAGDASATPEQDDKSPQTIVDETQAIDSGYGGNQQIAGLNQQSAIADVGSGANSQDDQAGDASAAEIALLKSDEDGVSLLQSDPVPPSTIVLDTISYSDDGTVQLSGRASIDVLRVRIYLDNAVVAQLLVDDSGNWRSEIPGVAPGVYTLRVDALDDGGTVVSRIETPFKREAPEQLAAASDGQTGSVRSVTVQAGDTLWAIARSRYGEGLLYVQVFDANKDVIRDPDLIYPGQVFELPSE
ncbi:MAG: LysM peptidoglycan-binding domain-containing protein [Pseudomonadota bacterium]